MASGVPVAVSTGDERSAWDVTDRLTVYVAPSTRPVRVSSEAGAAGSSDTAFCPGAVAVSR